MTDIVEQLPDDDAEGPVVGREGDLRRVDRLGGDVVGGPGGPAAILLEERRAERGLLRGGEEAFPRGDRAGRAEVAQNQLKAFVHE